MQTQPGVAFRTLGLAGYVTTCSDTSVFVEFGDHGFLTVLTECNGPADCVIALALPDWMLNETTKEQIKANVIEQFELDPELKYAIHVSHVAIDGGFATAMSAASPYVSAKQSTWLAEPAKPEPVTLESVIQMFIPGYRWDRPANEDIYQVPKRFDLASMFSISVAFALLFAIMRALGAPPVLIAVAGVYFAVVGMAQAMLFQGEKPREASIIVGALFGVIVMIVGAFMSGRPGLAIGSVACSFFWAPALGYLIGTVNGGIWLVTDYLRQWLELRGSTKQVETPDVAASPFDSVSGDAPE